MFSSAPARPTSRIVRRNFTEFAPSVLSVACRRMVVVTQASWTIFIFRFIYFSPIKTRFWWLKFKLVSLLSKIKIITKFLQNRWNLSARTGPCSARHPRTARISSPDNIHAWFAKHTVLSLSLTPVTSSSPALFSPSHRWRWKHYNARIHLFIYIYIFIYRYELFCLVVPRLCTRLYTRTHAHTRIKQHAFTRPDLGVYTISCGRRRRTAFVRPIPGR